MTPAAERALAICPAADGFAARYSVAAQTALTKNEDACLLRPDLPTLKGVADAYGDGPAAAWLYGHIINAVEYSGARKDEMNLQSYEDLARNMLVTYADFNPLEVLLFFRLFKGGKLGTFYGTADALKLANALNVFCKRREDSAGRVRREREAAHRRKEEARRALEAPPISYEEYLRGKAEAAGNAPPRP